MSQNTVSDPITDQEIAFAHLILSETMDDRRAAEAVGLNPDTAVDTKAKPHVRAYIIEHRAANEKLVNQEADLSRLPWPAVGCAGEEPRKPTVGRDQILTRLWELANLSHELTRGSIAGQIKALVMIIAIEGLNPDRRRPSTYATQPAPPPAAPHAAEPDRTPEPDPDLASDASSSNLDRSQPGVATPFINPQPLNGVPAATGVVNKGNSFRPFFSPGKRRSRRRR